MDGHMMKIKIALAQFNTTLGEVEANLNKHLELIGEAQAIKADVLIFPELSLTGYALQDLAVKTAPYWEKALCGRCAGNDSPQRCRRHLVEEISQGVIKDLSLHVSLVNDIETHMRMYNRSFCHGYHGTDTDEDRAALISAVGWCSGWKTLLSIVGAT